jgi:TP901 family phage tail tape measure protein
MEINHVIERAYDSSKKAGLTKANFFQIAYKALDNTGRSGSVIGNSLKTLFTRLQRRTVYNRLERAGVTIRTKRGNYRKPMTILRELSKAWPTLTDGHKSHICEILGGVYQMNVIRAVFNE